MKILIVNADDFGFTHDVNAGIIEAHRKGILTATTLMANGRAFNDAVRLAKEHAGLDVGVHCVLIGGNSLLTGLPLPVRIQDLVYAVMSQRIKPYEELRSQIERIIAAGIRPTHLDTHKHTHLLPPVLDAIARLSEEFGIRWVRRPFDFPLNGMTETPLSLRLLSRCMGGLRFRFHAVLSRHGCYMTDHFAGFQLTGRFRAPELVSLIQRLPDGITELMCHPGHCTEELRRMSTRLKENRQKELDALVSPEARRALVEQRVELARYRDLHFTVKSTC